jgi:6-phosphofructokinase 1
MSVDKSIRLGNLTSGSDAQGMYSAVRAIVRTALDRGVPIYAIPKGTRAW